MILVRLIDLSELYRVNGDVTAIRGECLEEMSKLPDSSIDLILCDLPYGTTQNKCAGSFTTGVACIKTNRKFIGIEQDENYFQIGKKRMEDALEKRLLAS